MQWQSVAIGVDSEQYVIDFYLLIRLALASSFFFAHDLKNAISTTKSLAYSLLLFHTCSLRDDGIHTTLITRNHYPPLHTTP